MTHTTPPVLTPSGPSVSSLASADDTDDDGEPIDSDHGTPQVDDSDAGMRSLRLQERIDAEVRAHTQRRTGARRRDTTGKGR